MHSGQIEALDLRARRYEVLLRLLGRIASGMPENLAQTIASELREVFDFVILGVLVLRDGDEKPLWQMVGATLPAEPPDFRETATWWVYENQQPLMIHDWSVDTRFREIRDLIRSCGIDAHSLYDLPLTTAHRRVGALGVATCKANAYNDEDRLFLSAFTETLALAIENALHKEEVNRARKELELQNTRLQFLLDVTNRVTSNLELRELLRAVSASVRQAMDCDGVGISLPDSEPGKFRVYALDFPSSKGLIHEEMVIAVRSGAASKALATRKAVVAHVANPEEYDPQLHALAFGEGMKTQCFIPLVNHGRVVGMLVLGRMTENSFSHGDVEFLGQMAGQIAIAVENSLAYQDIKDLKDRLAQEKLYLEDEIRSELNFEQIVGSSLAIKQVLNLVETVATSDSTVLLLGETGTGKELIARAIHEHSRRKGRTFVKVNCAAIPTGLLESELFGHEKGAFTGAISQKIGRMELADQGTLFLDEVGDVPLEIQPKLLRILQEREFERLGSTRTKKVNVRLIAATNRDLEEMIAAQAFRSDLFYRLNVFPIQIPPLRERREDIPLLVRYFVQKYAREMQKPIESIPSAALKQLQSHDWPGNIRELENFIERAVILTNGKSLTIPPIGVDHSRARANQPSTRSNEDVESIVRKTIQEMRKDGATRSSKDSDERQKSLMVEALKAANGRIGGPKGAAEKLGLKRTTFISRMEKLGLTPREFSR